MLALKCPQDMKATTVKGARKRFVEGLQDLEQNDDEGHSVLR
jgi:hypothetical protein